ncbi:MAG: hypothetical protein HZB38_09960 [Planctomycetes bacterium]|nr:hypothetical protein [Planctomycetota bacterium]
MESKKHRYIAARDGRPIVSFLPKDSTLKDKYATLAALHDELRPDSKKMFPLRVRRRFKNRRFRARRLIAGMSYQALCKSVLFVEADLPDARSVIQAAFQAVERDLARPRGIPQAVGGSGRRSPNVTHAKADGPGVKRRSPRAKLTKRQKEVANKVAECKDNQTEAAKKLGVKPATVRKTMWAVRKKTKTADSTPSQSVRARTLPQDNRGQANLSDRNDE